MPTTTVVKEKTPVTFLNDNPIVSILAAMIIFLLGAAMGAMYTRIQFYEGKLGPVAAVPSAPSVPTDPSLPTEPVAPTEINVQVTDADPVKGNANAKVTIVEFADFQCPFCGRFHSQVLPEIIKEYVDTGKAKFVYKNLAFLGKESTDAANAALCAKEQNKYWEYHDHLYNNQNGENQGAFAPDILKKWAVDLGLNAAQFNTCLDTGKYNAQVEADVAEANKNGFNSTPSTAVGTTPIVGAQPYATFKAAIEAELAK